MHTIKLSNALFRAGKAHELLPLAGLSHMVPDPLVTRRLQNAADAELRLPGVTVENVNTGFHEIRYDFVVEVFPTADGCEANWTYRSALFEEATIAGMATEFEAILSDGIRGSTAS